MSIANKFTALSAWRHKLRAHATPGGIRPKAYKKTSLRSRIMPTPIPGLLILPLGQHQGTAAEALVSVGDRVLKYQTIAAAAQSNSVAVHAPTSGTIVAIENSPVARLANNLNESQLCIHLEPDGKDSATELYPESDYHLLDHSQLLQRIADAGICGMGGAGFPTRDKLQLSIDHKIDLLIINAVECEPYITADEALIRERAEAVVQGAEILLAATRASRCVIGIEDSKTDAITKLVAALKNSSVELMVIGTKYPAGGEKQLIQAVTGKEVPSGLHPADIGILLQNAGTAYAAYNAIILGQPCISRITTLTGLALQTPKNFETLLGIPISFLFELCGINESARLKTIIGGSMMGIEVSNTAVPVTKTTNCVIAGCAEEFPSPTDEHACIRCGFCATACPASLLPQQLLSYSKSSDHQQLQDHGLFDCIECGACAYVCPSKIPLVQYYRASKSKIKARQASHAQSARWQNRFQFHQFRIKKTADDTSNKKPRDTPAADIKPKLEDFSRDEARRKIADAVARVQTRKSKLIASTKNANSNNGNMPGVEE
ncbi:MAG: electron transport complex subunit RsxC [Pseudohongiella sp.]|nr:electron transport complex subunit RsxC [Pseudohongiella sp.]